MSACFSFDAAGRCGASDGPRLNKARATSAMATAATRTAFDQARGATRRGERVLAAARDNRVIQWLGLTFSIAAEQAFSHAGTPSQSLAYASGYCGSPECQLRSI